MALLKNTRNQKREKTRRQGTEGGVVQVGALRGQIGAIYIHVQALRSAGGIRRPLRLLAQQGKTEYYEKRTKVHD